MPMYAYIVKDANGKTKKGIAESLDEEALVDKLQGEGFFVLNVRPAVKESSQPQATKADAAASRKFSHNKVKLNDLLVLARELATLLESGVPLMRALVIICDQIQSKELYRVLSQVAGEVEQGKTLSNSMARHPKVFNQFWVSLVEVGEASGTMPAVLHKLVRYSEQEAAFRSSVTSALIYPIVLFCASLGAIAFFALFVAPRFEGIFNSMHIELPALTKVLLFIFKVVKEKALLLLTVAGVTFFLFRQYIRTSHGALVFEKAMFNLPVFGEMYKLIVVERFASQLSVLVDSGVPILFALEITERLVGNRTCALVVANIRESAREGKLLANPMQQSGFFPPMAVQMVKVGEETGQLGEMLRHVAEFYQKHVETFTKRFGIMLEPLMLVFMGGVIGTIVVAMFLPLFNLSSGG